MRGTWAVTPEEHTKEHGIWGGPRKPGGKVKLRVGRQPVSNHSQRPFGVARPSAGTKRRTWRRWLEAKKRQNSRYRARVKRKARWRKVQSTKGGVREVGVASELLIFERKIPKFLSFNKEARSVTNEYIPSTVNSDAYWLAHSEFVGGGPQGSACRRFFGAEPGLP